MHFFNGLPHELFRMSNTAQRNLDASTKEALELGLDSDLFQKLSQDVFYADLAKNEHGRFNHMALKTAFESVP